MSIFEGLPDFLKALESFIALPIETQSALIAQFFEGEESLKNIPGEQQKMLLLMTLEIQVLLPIYSKDFVITALAEKGMNSTIARVLVDQLEKLPASPEMDAQVLSKVSLEKFDAVMRYIIVDFYLGGKRNFQEASGEIQVSSGILQSALRIARDSIIYPVLRGELSQDQIVEELTELGLPKDRAEIIRTLYNDNQAKINSTRLFDDLYSVRSQMTKLTESQEETLAVLKEILELLKGQREPKAAPYG